MNKSKQLSFIKPGVKFFGGALLHKKRKSRRPLSSKDAIHFVLRSQWAMGRDSFLKSRNKPFIDRTVARFAKNFGVQIYRQSVNSNHIHLLLRITNRTLYRAFIKAISGKIATHVMKDQSFFQFMKGRNQVGTNGFWQFRPFSRVVCWGRDFKTCAMYVKQNVLEALGFVPYSRRKNYYLKWISETVPPLR